MPETLLQTKLYMLPLCPKLLPPSIEEIPYLENVDFYSDRTKRVGRLLVSGERDLRVAAAWQLACRYPTENDQ
jgi:hypothetical protein